MTTTKTTSIRVVCGFDRIVMVWIPETRKQMAERILAGQAAGLFTADDTVGAIRALQEWPETRGKAVRILTEQAAGRLTDAEAVAALNALAPEWSETCIKAVKLIQAEQAAGHLTVSQMPRRWPRLMLLLFWNGREQRRHWQAIKRGSCMRTMSISSRVLRVEGFMRNKIILVTPGQYGPEGRFARIKLLEVAAPRATSRGPHLCPRPAPGARAGTQMCAVGCGVNVKGQIASTRFRVFLESCTRIGVKPGGTACSDSSEDAVRAFLAASGPARVPLRALRALRRIGLWADTLSRGLENHVIKGFGARRTARGTAMEEQELKLTVTVDDQASAQIQRMRNTLDTMGTGAQAAGMERTRRQTGEVGAGAKLAAQEMRGFAIAAGVVGGLTARLAGSAVEFLGNVTNLRTYTTQVQELGQRSVAAGLSMAQYKANVGVFKEVGVSAEAAGQQIQNLGDTQSDLLLSNSTGYGAKCWPACPPNVSPRWIPG